MSINRWMDKEDVIHTNTHKHTHIHTMEYSVIKKNEILLFAAKVGLGGHYAKWNKSDRERQILYDITYMWNLKNTTN